MGRGGHSACSCAHVHLGDVDAKLLGELRMIELIGLSRVEFWAAVFVLCLPALIYLLQDAAREMNAPPEPEYKWGMAQRRETVEPFWASHLTLAPVTLFLVLFTLRMAGAFSN